MSVGERQAMAKRVISCTAMTLDVGGGDDNVRRGTPPQFNYSSRRIQLLCSYKSADTIVVLYICGERHRPKPRDKRLKNDALYVRHDHIKEFACGACRITAVAPGTSDQLLAAVLSMAGRNVGSRPHQTRYRTRARDRTAG
ncbi:hypothetical protein QTP88_002580 [Uroleucon formosanum]